MAEKKPVGTTEASRSSVKQLVQAKPGGRCGAQLLCPEGGLKIPSKGSLCECQQSGLKDHVWSLAALGVFAQTGKIKTESV